MFVKDKRLTPFGNIHSTKMGSDLKNPHAI